MDGIRRRKKTMNDLLQAFSDSSGSNVSTSVKLMILLTVMSLAPSILILMTSFTRIVIVLSFVRTSLATQQMPPNQVIIGLALFLTFFIMAPTFQEVIKKRYNHYLKKKLLWMKHMIKQVCHSKNL